jgi:hypothetical protein
VIDSSSNYADKYSHQPIINSNINNNNHYSSATITKRRHPVRGLSASSVQHIDIGLSTLEFTNIEIETNNSSHLSNKEENINSNYYEPLNQQPQQYEDIIDVQVIAKMQEESE